ncbi:MAG: glycosyltransferase family 4 protein [Bacteroidales bacterium]|nr:glycosyltransferase family 4 protein [Bacteroidales bacterium]
MVIGFDAKRAFFNRSGLGNYSRNTLWQLVTYFPSHQYVLYTPSLKNRIELPYEDKVTLVSQDPALPSVFSSWWRSFHITRRIRHDKLSLFHGLSNELPFGIHRSGVPSVVTIHDLIFLQYPELYKITDVLIYKAKFSSACRNANAIIAVSRQTADDIVRYFSVPPEKVHVVYQSCNPLFAMKISSEDQQRIKEKYRLPSEYILSVGTIEERKNQLRILEALNHKNIRIPLVLVGKEKAYALKIRKYIAANKMRNVILLNEIENEDLPAIYQGALLFVYPSLIEGFGIPILEALYSGVPVITSEGGCFPEAGGPDSLYVNPRRSDQIAEAIDSLLKDPSRCRKMRDAGKEYARNFSPETVASRLMEVYQKIAL